MLPEKLLFWPICIPQFPHLVSQFFVNQQGFDVDFGEHEASVTGLWIECLVRNWPFLAEMGPIRRGAGRENTVFDYLAMTMLITMLQFQKGLF